MSCVAMRPWCGVGGKKCIACVHAAERVPSPWDCAERGHVPTPEGGCLNCGAQPTCRHGYDGPHAVYHDVLVSGCHGFESQWFFDCQGPEPTQSEPGVDDGSHAHG